MKDVNGKEITVGAKIVYAVRDGSCLVALRSATVLGVTDKKVVAGAEFTEWFTSHRPTYIKKVTLSHPKRIAVVL